MKNKKMKLRLNRSQRRICAKSRCRRRRLAYLEFQRQEALQEMQQQVQRKVLEKIDSTIKYCEARLAAERDQPLVDPQLGTTPPEQFGIGLKPTPEPFSVFGPDGKYVPAHKSLEDLSAESDFRPRMTLPQALLELEQRRLERLERWEPLRPDCERVSNECDLERPVVGVPFRTIVDNGGMSFSLAPEYAFPKSFSRCVSENDLETEHMLKAAVVRVAKRPNLRKRIACAIKRFLGK